MIEFRSWVAFQVFFQLLDRWFLADNNEWIHLSASFIMAKGDGQGGVDVIEISSTQPKDKKVTEKKPYTGYGFKEVRISNHL